MLFTVAGRACIEKATDIAVNNANVFILFFISLYCDTFDLVNLVQKSEMAGNEIVSDGRSEDG